MEGSTAHGFDQLKEFLTLAQRMLLKTAIGKYSLYDLEVVQIGMYSEFVNLVRATDKYFSLCVEMKIPAI